MGCGLEISLESSGCVIRGTLWCIGAKEFCTDGGGKVLELAEGGDVFTIGAPTVEMVELLEELVVGGVDTEAAAFPCSSEIVGIVLELPLVGLSIASAANIKQDRRIIAIYKNVSKKCISANMNINKLYQIEVSQYNSSCNFEYLD